MTESVYFFKYAKHKNKYIYFSVNFIHTCTVLDQVILSYYIILCATLVSFAFDILAHCYFKHIVLCYIYMLVWSAADRVLRIYWCF